MKTSIKPVPEFTQDQLAKRWKCSKRTARRDISVFKLEPCRRNGLQPFFSEPDVLAMEFRRERARVAFLDRLRGVAPRSGRILTVRQAKAIAARRAS